MDPAETAIRITLYLATTGMTCGVQALRAQKCAQLCAKESDGTALDSLQAASNLHGLDMIKWMKLVVHALQPGTPKMRLYCNTEQCGHESPDAFRARRKLMAILAGAVPQMGGDYDYNIPGFVSATYPALNRQTKRQMGLEDTDLLTYPILGCKLDQVSELMRATGTGYNTPKQNPKGNPSMKYSAYCTESLHKDNSLK